MKFQAKKAVRTKRPLKISLEGLSGSGKTYTALRLAFDMRRAGIGKRIVVLDSENGSASLYADVTEDGERWEFDTVDLTPDVCNPQGYAEAYRWAVSQGYDIIVFDSLSHAWHGALEQVDAMAGAKGDKFRAWANVTPLQRDMIETLTNDRAHCIVTMRVKGEYERTTDANGRAQIKKVGLKTDQRENTEYEFDLVLRFEQGNECRVEKVRGCSQMNTRHAVKPGPSFWQPLFDWWKGGAEVVQEPVKKAEGPATVKGMYDALAKKAGPTNAGDLLIRVLWIDAQLTRLVDDHGIGDTVAAVCEFSRVDSLGEVEAEHVGAAWRKALGCVANCIAEESRK